MGRLKGKVAIVTGAASGIGKATVELFRSEGATVVGADAVEGADTRSDAGSEGAVRDLVEQVVQQHGGLDIFFANAGISGGFASIAEQTEADWAEILRVNLIGPFLAIKYAAPQIARRGGGSIICTASVAGLRSGAGGAAYSASKAGVIALTKSLGKELATENVIVNCVTPGSVETDMFKQMTEEHIKYMLSKIPMGRFGKIEEIAGLVAWLASEECSFSTGAVFDISGGRATY